ncbi:GDP-mannose transporter GONST2 [Acorus calamus]|uniref:GDP-mannose transporter GONST2 n=1 Tax=Acorus calamus TaxID=4465 RepID=A0AAV9CJR1_ACOCL|nr:GDP-mannose transporter GONST2 [Acorus calamus]
MNMYHHIILCVSGDAVLEYNYYQRLPNKVLFITRYSVLKAPRAAAYAAHKRFEIKEQGAFVHDVSLPTGQTEKPHNRLETRSPLLSGMAYSISSCNMILLNKVVLSSYGFNAAMTLTRVISLHGKASYEDSGVLGSFFMPLKCKEIQNSKLKAQWEVDFGTQIIWIFDASHSVHIASLVDDLPDDDENEKVIQISGTKLRVIVTVSANPTNKTVPNSAFAFWMLLITYPSTCSAIGLGDFEGVTGDAELTRRYRIDDTFGNTVPEGILQKLEGIRRRFYWSGTHGDSRKSHMIRWDLVYSRKRMGGAGVLNLGEFNKALLSKWRWRWMSN